MNALRRFKKIPIFASAEATRIRNTMCKLWTNFAKYDDPTPPNAQFPFVWSPVKHVDRNSPFNLDFLNIDDEQIGMQKNPHELRMNFWRKMFKKYNDGFLNANLWCH